MLGHKSTLPTFVRFVVLIIVVLWTSGRAGAQNPDKPRVANLAEPLAASETAASAPEGDSKKTVLDSNRTRAAASVDAKSTAASAAPAASPQPPAQCKRTITADVVALPQPIMLNRLGAAIPDGLVFALTSDTVGGAGTQLRPDKRPRPLVLRANVGDCLTITFKNSIPQSNFTTTKAPGASTGTTEVSLHIQGMEWVRGPQDDGSFVGANNSSLASAAAATPPMPPQTQVYSLYAREEGTFLLYTMGDTTSFGDQLTRGLFGALNVEPAGAEWYRSQVTADDLQLAATGQTPDGHPIVNYDAVYPAGNPRAGLPILKMLGAGNNIVDTDLTAIITGPNGGRFPGTTGVDKPEPACNAENNPALNPPPGGKVDPLFCANPASPDRKQPYREITILYHGGLTPIAAQAFPVFADSTMRDTVTAGQDMFAINYGTGGIGAEIYANRIGVGPMGNCVDCKFEEFFLSAWSVGDPAMLVDNPANSNNLATNPPFQAPCNSTTAFQGPSGGGAPNPACANARNPVSGFPYTLAGLAKATKAFFPDDPSNVYHSYINDHVKFRILHGGRDVTHVHHQHAHQWLQSPNSDEASYLDSQMISPGASYTLEMVYNGSGNRNKVVGDSIFHCHFYPHFAAGMWAMWRTHDVFESGSQLANGIPLAGTRAYPDGEIKAGTPIPALVPMPTLPMAPLPSPVFIDQGQIVFGTPAAPDKTGQNVTVNPGYPFFIPGLAGARAPHPPLDFACTQKDAQGHCMPGTFLDGGLPRHLVTGGSISKEKHDTKDWSKDLATVNAVQLAEDGTPVEKVAMAFFHQRCYTSFFPNGTPGSCPSSTSTSPQTTLLKPPTGFILNGLPRGPQQGAPFADPAVDDNGNPIGNIRIYKAAAFQLNVVFNKKGWHFPQQRMLSLWEDVLPTYAYKPGSPGGRQPEPLFFRGNSGDIIEYWHTNLVPNYYDVDDFQVRTPTDILGQHIHLVKFDVTSSDGAGNGFNYEDGTFSPEEVQDLIKAIKAPGGSWTPCTGCTEVLRPPQPPPAEICFGSQPPTYCTKDWLGAQTTIQRWFLDPQVDDSNADRTLRTVFTHDHFGPSTHQQAGLYAGLLVEPKGSTWTSNDGASTFGSRPDGGPTSWQARIITTRPADSYREFMLEFQDLQLAYTGVPIGGKDPAINPPSTPSLVTTGIPDTPAGTQSVNYTNEPIAFRVGSSSVFTPPSKFSDLSYVFDNSIQKTVNPLNNPDPMTPLLRAYQNDKVQVRILVGAHVFAHQFNLEGPTWFAEPSWKNSGYRSAQAMGLSEHFELLFNVPPSSAPSTGRKCPDGMSQANCADYLYSPSLDESGLANGLWGLLRAYDPTKVATNLKPLPNNPVSASAHVSYATCPSNLTPAQKRVFNITAVTAQQALPGGQIVFNSRAIPPGTPSTTPLNIKTGIMYVFNDDLDSSGKLRPGVPIEPLILRANAGDCIQVNLTNAIADNSDLFKANFSLAPPLTGPPYPAKASNYVGLHPQLLSYDGAQSNGINVGWNSQGQQDQVAGFGKTVTYTWYAGKIDRSSTGHLVYTPAEFGSLNLFPSDLMFQNINGLFGAMIIEPQKSTWKCGEAASLRDCIPPNPPPPSPAPPPASRASATVTLTNQTKFREFALMLSDSLNLPVNPDGSANNSAVNYRTEPMNFRYAANANQSASGDHSCMLANQLAGGDPQTPIFTADVGDKVRFRLTHPFGTGTSQVFSLHGHVWQRNPYKSNSKVIGHNKLSQWLGSRDNHGSTDHFDLVIDKAGGEGGKGGDYLYSVFVPIQARQGPWGIFRVGPLMQAANPNSACLRVAPPSNYAPPSPKKDQLDPFIRRPLNKGTRP